MTPEGTFLSQKSFTGCRQTGPGYPETHMQQISKGMNKIDMLRVLKPREKLKLCGNITSQTWKTKHRLDGGFCY